MPLPNVNSGELIRAADWNDLVAALNALEARVAELESGGSQSPPRIARVLPAGEVTTGDTIRIFGSNFDFSQGGHSVFFGNTRATNFLSGSSNTLLIVQVPSAVEGATPDGTPMTMTVGNLHGFTTWAITIVAQPELPTGGFEFSYDGSRPTAPTEENPILYDFALNSFAGQDLTITITPTIQLILPLPPGIPDPGLAGRLAVIDADGTVRTNRQIQLAEGESKTISVRLDIPDQSNGVRYTLSVQATAPDTQAVVESVPDQEVGEESEQPDPTVSNFEFASIAEGDATFSTETGGVSGVEGTFAVQQGSTATVEMRTVFQDIPAGTTNNYQLSAAVDSPANGWSTSVNPIMQNPLPIQGPGGLIMTYFDLTSPATSASAVVRFTLTRQGADTENRRTVAYRLTVA